VSLSPCPPPGVEALKSHNNHPRGWHSRFRNSRGSKSDLAVDEIKTNQEVRAGFRVLI